MSLISQPYSLPYRTHMLFERLPRDGKLFGISKMHPLDEVADCDLITLVLGPVNWRRDPGVTVACASTLVQR